MYLNIYLWFNYCGLHTKTTADYELTVCDFPIAVTEKVWESDSTDASDNEVVKKSDVKSKPDQHKPAATGKSKSEAKNKPVRFLHCSVQFSLFIKLMEILKNLNFMK